MNTKRRKAKRINYVGYLFIFPSMFFFCLYILYPVFFVVKNGLYEWSTLSNMKLVGLANFSKLLSDHVFWQAIKNSFIWILTTVPVQAILGFLLGFAIEARIRTSGKLRGTFYRTLYFIPVVTSVTVVAIIFSKIFQPYQGIIG